jgi:hypothetical protein
MPMQQSCADYDADGSYSVSSGTFVTTIVVLGGATITILLILLNKRRMLIALYRDPANRIVSYIKAKDYKSNLNSNNAAVKANTAQNRGTTTAAQVSLQGNANTNRKHDVNHLNNPAKNKAFVKRDTDSK